MSVEANFKQAYENVRPIIERERAAAGYPPTKGKTMSWSVNATGKPKAVAAKLAEQFAKIKCTEPEETIKQDVAHAISAALGAYPEDGYAVKVEASGSQNGSTLPVVNNLSVKIEPIYGFAE